MGRPLFSQAYATASPTVRVEPEPTQQYENWTYWNPFDPDSEEFFANAEVETPVEVVQGDDPRSVTPVVVEVESSSSSEASSSGRGSPTQDELDEENFSVEELDTRMRRGFTVAGRRAPAPSSAPERLYAYREPVHVVISSPTSPIVPSTPPLATPALSPSIAHTVARAPADRDIFTDEDFEYFNRDSAVPAVLPTQRPTIPSTPPPSTPRLANSPLPSPPPSVMPRIYTWNISPSESSLPPSAPSPSPARANLSHTPPRRWTPRYTTYTHGTSASASSPSPSATASAGSPLPNLGARMSVAHISPSITSGRIRI